MPSSATQLLLILFLAVSLTAISSDYEVSGTFTNSSTIILNLTYTGDQTYYLKPTSPIVKHLQFIYHAYTFSDFYFKIIDADHKRFQMFDDGIYPYDMQKSFSFPIGSSAVNITYTSSPFAFTIIRKSTKAVIFSTQNKKFVFSNYYLEIGTQIDSEHLYGLGQRLAQGFRVKDGRWSMFNRDRGEQIDTGVGIQTYSYYPFYLLKERNFNFHLSYFRGTNALDVIKETSADKHFLTYKTIGGVIDFRFFLEQQNPEAVIERFNYYGGRSQVPPFWAMGYHQSRWGYKDITALNNIAANFTKHNIPLDTLWSDLDYMVNSQVFTIDENKFPLTAMKKLLQTYRWIPIIDPGIKNNGSIYQEGLKRNAYILDAGTKKPALGKMRVGSTVYPDFFQTNTSQYWHDMLQTLYNKVPFSGVWLDSNEFTSFCTGQCSIPTYPSVFDYNNDLPYTPGADDLQGDTISLNSTHHGGLIEADVHIYNGFLEVQSTYRFLKNKKIHPFILTRSSILGTHKYATHWTGDNAATWQFLRSSIADNFNNQLWGHQMVGADICGFAGNSTAELCARWYQLGSFYPFARNHNQQSATSQQPFAFGDNDEVIKAASVNLKLRYSLLKHIYSILVLQKGLGTLWRPLYLLDPTNPNLYLDEIMDTQFTIGDKLLVTPILEQGKTSRTIYLPRYNWYDFYTGKQYTPGTYVIQNIKTSDRVPLFLREQSVIFTQNTDKVLQTKDLDNHFIITATLKYSERMTDEESKAYMAYGLMMSLKNFNNDTQVDFCLSGGCYFEVKLLLRVSPSWRKLDIWPSYRGMPTLGQTLLIDGIKLFYDNKKIELTLSEPYSTTDYMHTIDLPDDEMAKSLQVE